MTFENRNEKQINQIVSNEDAGKTVTDKNPGNATTPSPDAAARNPEEVIDMIGGQPKADESGLDISQYTGPGSKPSSSFDDQAAPKGTGPGNGLSMGQTTEGGDWENPEGAENSI